MLSSRASLLAMTHIGRLVLLLPILAAVLAACGKSESKQGDVAAPKADSVSIAKREVLVAAAADLRYALDDLIAEFQTLNKDVTVEVSYGSSGNFHAQLVNRAPFDIYFSADVAYPKKLIEAGVAQQDSLFTYAVGRLAVWVRAESALDPAGKGVAVLNDPTIRRIAIANPDHAPYGRAAVSMLQHFGTYDRLKPKLVLGENVQQAAQFVETGAAEIGVIALPLAVAMGADKGRYWEPPVESYPRLEQGGVILNWAKDRAAAEQLRAFVLSERGRAVLKRNGFYLPTE